jgi:hypothetical protein
MDEYSDGEDLVDCVGLSRMSVFFRADDLSHANFRETFVI